MGGFGVTYWQLLVILYLAACGLWVNIRWLVALLKRANADKRP